LGIGDKIFLLSEVLKVYSLFLVYKTNIFVKLLKLNNTFLFFLYFSFVGFGFFCSDRRHLLITLLRLEFIVLVLFLVMYYYLCSFNYELYLVVVFLVFSVCEGSLGLSISVSIIRRYGNDYYQSCRVLQC
jgi:NADH-ubiquinone oxidoreductase chain 4L